MIKNKKRQKITYPIMPEDKINTNYDIEEIDDSIITLSTLQSSNLLILLILIKINFLIKTQLVKLYFSEERLLNSKLVQCQDYWIINM